MLKRTFDPAEPPRPERRSHAATWHGVTLVDDFAWLRAANWQEVMRDPNKLDPAIRAYLEAENAYAEQALAGTTTLQDTLFAEMKGRIKEDDSTVPANDGPYAYYLRYREGGQHPAICRMPRGGGRRRAPARRRRARARQGLLQSRRHRAFARTTACSRGPRTRRAPEFYTVRIRDLATRARSCRRRARCDGFGRVDQRCVRVLLRAARPQPSPVARVPASSRHAGGGRRARLRGDGTGLFRFHRRDAIAAASGRSRSTITRPRKTGCSTWPMPTRCRALVAAREKSVQYDVEHHPNLFGQDALVLRTNADGAEDFKIVWTPRGESARPSAGATSFRIAPASTSSRSSCWRTGWCGSSARTGCRASWCAALPRAKSTRSHSPRKPIRSGMDGGYEFATNTLRFTYSSMTTPAEVWDYDLAARTRTLRKRQEVPSGHDPSAYVTRRVFAPTPRRRDGADLDPAPQGFRARRNGALPALRLRRLRDFHAGRVQHQPALAGRSRLRLRDRARARRDREGLALVPRRQAEEEAQHLPRLHHRGGIPGGRALDRGRSHRRAGRVGRRHAGGRGRQHAARTRSAPSSPRCRSSTCSTRCWTTACR